MKSLLTSFPVPGTGRDIVEDAEMNEMPFSPCQGLYDLASLVNTQIFNL